MVFFFAIYMSPLEKCLFRSAYLFIYFDIELQELFEYVPGLFYFIFYLYNIVLVLPYINMNLPQVYTCSPSWTLPFLPPRTIPLGRPSAPAPSIQYRASNLDWRLISYDIIHVSCFNAILSNHPTLSLSHRVQKTVLYISVPFVVSYTGLLLPSF